MTAKDLHISLEPADGSDLTVPCAELYRGSTYCDRLPLRSDRLTGFNERDGWNNGYRSVWINAEARAILTECEGDLDLTIDATDTEFAARVASAEAFYDRQR